MGPARRGAVQGRTVRDTEQCRGWGKAGGTPSPPPGTACAFLGREPREAEPSLHTHGVRHHHHINNERAAPSKLFVPAPARAQNAEEAREPHPKQPWGERRGARMVLRWSFTRPLTRNDKNLPGPRWVLSLLGVWLLGGSLRRSGAAHGVRSSCSQHCPVQAPLSPSVSRKGRFGCRGRSFSPEG